MTTVNDSVASIINQSEVSERTFQKDLSLETPLNDYKQSHHDSKQSIASLKKSQLSQVCNKGTQVDENS